MFRFEDFMRDVIMNNNSQELYESLSNDNPSFVVMKIYDQIKNNKKFKFRKEKKSEIVSEMFRLQGNENFKNKKYGKTLQLYNNALLYAPPNTQAMRLAYSNRSVLLFKCRQYEEALKDIEKCFQLGGYDSEVKEKLEKRKERCDTIIRSGFVQHIVSKKDMQFSQPNIFEMYSKHAEIPEVSKEVHIHAKSESLRVLAAKDIHPGTVVASEIGFVTAMTKDYFNISCYYCQNTILNLIPCDNCCVALFCDDNCRKQCLLEYHEIECNLVNRDYDNLMSLVLRAIVKIRNKCADWNEFLKMFDSINQSGGKVDIYNTISSDSKLSLLTDTQVTKLYGRKFNHAFNSAVIIYHLTEYSSFFPKQFQERQSVVTATAKQLMYLFSQTPVVLKSVVNDISIQNLAFLNSQIGYFSLTGKLKHSCDPNIEAISIGNKVILIAIRPIKGGDELTRSYVDREEADRELLLLYSNAQHYNCHACAERQTDREWHFTSEQEMLLRSGILKHENYRILCDLLAVFDNLRHTKFYQQIYDCFNYFIGYNQYRETKNMFLGRSLS